jgi:hypothetical protein
MIHAPVHNTQAEDVHVYLSSLKATIDLRSWRLLTAFFCAGRTAHNVVLEGGTWQVAPPVTGVSGAAPSTPRQHSPVPLDRTGTDFISGISIGPMT